MGEIIMGYKVNEIWKPVKGYEGLYEISNYGRVKGMERVTKFGTQNKIYPERILKPKRRKGLYSSYVLCNTNGHKTIMIHRLVALHFIPNPESKRCINHKDGNKENNHICNLEWVTHKENSKHARDTGLNKQVGNTCTLSLLTSEQVLHIRAEYKPRVITQKYLSKKYNVATRTIAHIIQRTSWKNI